MRSNPGKNSSDVVWIKHPTPSVKISHISGGPLASVQENSSNTKRYLAPSKNERFNVQLKKGVLVIKKVNFLKRVFGFHESNGFLLAHRT